MNLEKLKYAFKGYGVHLTVLDKEILEFLCDNDRDTGNRISNTLDSRAGVASNIKKLREHKFIIQVDNQNATSALYRITSKGENYLETPPFSLGEKIIIALTIIGILITSVGILLASCEKPAHAERGQSSLKDK
jgi:hypothetical protein